MSSKRIKEFIIETASKRLVLLGLIDNTILLGYIIL